MNNDRYINQSTMRKQRAKKNLLMILGWALTAFNGLGVIVFLTSDKKDSTVIFIPLFVASLLVLWAAFRCSGQISSARIFNYIFESDEDGYVHIDELTARTGRDSDKVLNRLEKLFRMGFFQNCSLSRGGSKPGVVLNDASAKNAAVGYVNVKCASCGGTSRIRAGTVGKCDYCGSPIQG